MKSFQHCDHFRSFPSLYISTYVYTIRQCQMDRNIMYQRCSIEFRSGKHGGRAMVSISSSFRNFGFVVHQEKPRTHCTVAGFDNVSKEFIPTPKGCQDAVVQPVKICASLHRYASPGGTKYCTGSQNTVHLNNRVFPSPED